RTGARPGRRAVAGDLVAAGGGDRRGARGGAQPATLGRIRLARLPGAAATEGLEQLAHALEDLAGPVEDQVLVHALSLLRGQGALAALDLRSASGGSRG